MAVVVMTVVVTLTLTLGWGRLNDTMRRPVFRVRALLPPRLAYGGLSPFSGIDLDLGVFSSGTFNISCGLWIWRSEAYLGGEVVVLVVVVVVTLILTFVFSQDDVWRFFLSECGRFLGAARFKGQMTLLYQLFVVLWVRIEVALRLDFEFMAQKDFS